MSKTLYQYPNDFKLIKGEEFDPVAIQLVDEDNVLLDVSNITSVVFEMYFDKSGRELALEKSGSVVVVDNALKCDLVEADTLYLDSGDYFGRFKFLDSAKIRYAPQASSVINIKLIS